MISLFLSVTLHLLFCDIIVSVSNIPLAIHGIWCRIKKQIGWWWAEWIIFYVIHKIMKSKLMNVCGACDFRQLAELGMGGGGGGGGAELFSKCPWYNLPSKSSFSPHNNIYRNVCLNTLYFSYSCRTVSQHQISLCGDFVGWKKDVTMYHEILPFSFNSLTAEASLWRLYGFIVCIKPKNIWYCADGIWKQHLAWLPCMCFATISSLFYGMYTLK